MGRLRILVMLERPKPLVYKALSLVVQMLAPNTIKAGTVRPWAIIT